MTSPEASTVSPEASTTRLEASVRPDGNRELLPTATNARIRATVGKLLRERRALTITAFGVLALSTVVGLLTAPLLGHIVDVVADGRPAGAITTPVVLLVVVAVAQGVLTAVGVTLVARLGEGVLAVLRERFVERALTLPLEQVERAGTGDLTSRVTNDVTRITEAVRGALPEMAHAALTIGFTLVGLAVLDWRFTLAALLAAPVQFQAVRWYAGRSIPLYAEQRIAAGAQQQQLLDTIGGAATVRAFRRDDEHIGRVTRRSRTTVDLALRGIHLITRFYARLNLAEFIGLAAVLTVGFLLVRNGSVTIGTATAAALYFHNLFNPINVALALVDEAQAATASLARMVGVADIPTTPEPHRPAKPANVPVNAPVNVSANVPDAAPVAVPATRPATRPVTAPVAVPVAVPVDASVRAAGVGHAYRPGHEVLRDVDLDIEQGERVALVGASGAGKTTLARLIAGIHRPTSGSIALGGVELDELGPAAVRRTVVLISQDVHVFAGPLADDLRLARPDAGDDELLAALDRVGAAGWAQALPEGLATVVGEGGHRLTVTQAQQLALARLVLTDPPVAILDEATADAGSAGARILEAAAEQALAGRTGLVVAHRLTQSAGADLVVVLDDGRIVETGTHDELIAAGGRYAALWEAWSDTRAPQDAPVGQ
ncbi:ABC transporter ATP-binding protein [Candidatus Protofrankia californiensis]|uniref:ABC transporter ATP-binding protein n=1 Tax=Candidatus Protofrankia californiensis TaxID=1839754 RepID=UPI001040FAEE|nr:ABC transporter ATP-binding protein [Candidatus Protofrankia californiensis]